jgi:uncharacterized protein (TIGR00730 family)
MTEPDRDVPAFDPTETEIGPDALPRTPEVDQLVQQIKETADKLIRDRASRGDVKLIATALREMRYAFKVFSGYRDRRKVAIFGSARTLPDTPAYREAVEFGRKIAEAGFMVVTGAASGIMEAGNVGAGRDASFGLNILLPFEQSSNPVVRGDQKLMHMRYFFTRKLMFVKEVDAVVLFPGGFGTLDEGFEVLTLVQTGKSQMMPVVLLDEPGGDYWRRWLNFVEEVLLQRGFISPPDPALYRLATNVDEAVREVTTFYRVYHSMRYVKGDLVLRLQRPISDATLERIQSEFTDVLAGGTFSITPALPGEANESQLAHLPRLRFRFDRHGHGRLRMLIDVLNQDGLSR